MQSKYKLTRQIPLTTTYYDQGFVIFNPNILAFAFHPRSGQGIYANVNSTKGIMMSGEVDKARGGNNSVNGGNMGGTIGKTSNGQVNGRRSDPIIDKTVEIDIIEPTYSSVLFE